MLNELKSKLKELAELRRDIQMSNEYIAERRAEYEATEAYKHYAIAAKARSELYDETRHLENEIKTLLINKLIDEGIHIKGHYTLLDFDLSQYLE